MGKKINIDKAKYLLDKFIDMRTNGYNFYNELSKMDEKGKGIDEPCHSKILTLLFKNSHHFRKHFLEHIGIINFDSWIDYIEVKTEENVYDVNKKYKGKIDILLYTQKTTSFLCVIENKIDSSFSEGQLKKYKDYVETNYNYYVQRKYTCTKRYWDNASSKDTTQVEVNDYIPIEHSEIPLMIDNNVLNDFERINPKMRYDIEQYKEFLNYYWYDTVDDISIVKTIKSINDNDLFKGYKDTLRTILDDKTFKKCFENTQVN